ncbi:AAA family ATPase [Thalassotalea ganghwensis]
MYTTFFGLSEEPFTIAPNPAYLFMSDRHREALAHLTYGLGSYGGFVLLTGEVGTGKTTICRSVMEQLSDDTQAVFILNPTLSSLELLATICDGLKIRYKKTGITVNYLMDKIQDKLIKNHQHNINTLLVIDEAQHLQAEVLEQLRLLTNLETNTKKLLQVILIGQPELQTLLQRRDLRQLAQRITARYHLLALTKTELSQYISHRLSVAQCTRALFDKGAISLIHQISNGIPRVVNLLCQQALLIAYGQNQTTINKKIVIEAAERALGEQGKVTSFWLQTPMRVFYAGIAMSVMLALGYTLATYTQTSSLAKVKQSDTGNTLQGSAQEPVITDLPPSNQDSDSAQTHAPSLDAKIQAHGALTTEEITSQTFAQRDLDNKKPVNESVIDNVKEPYSDDKNDIKLNTNDTEEHVAKQPKVLGYQPDKVKIVQRDDKKDGYEIVPVDGVSDELLARFKAAINETTPQEEQLGAEPEFVNETTTSVKPLSALPLSLRQALPELTFEMHIYASDGQGWVRVNGEDKYQGDMLSNELELTSILPQSLVLTFRGERFSVPALSSI